MKNRLLPLIMLLFFTVSACGERPGPGSTPDDDDTSGDDDDSSGDDDDTSGDDDDSSPPAVTQCSDGVDNDGDTWTDMEDPGCTNSSDDDESNQAVAPTPLLISGSWRDQHGITHVIEGSRSSDQCYDTIDNDGDGLVDGDDSDCVSASDDTEGIPISTGSWEQTSTIGGVRDCQITVIDLAAEFVVGQNSGNNAWSRFDWTYRGTDLYVCQVVDNATVALLAISNNTADRNNIASGCNGTDWLSFTAIPSP